MTAEEFVDALAELTGVAPEASANDDVFVKPLPKPESNAGARPFVRASLVKGTDLMRTLGRPNREQVVTTRPAEITTLEALELSNGQSLADLLEAGARKLLETHAGLSTEDLCRLLVRDALSRDPTDAELSRLREIAGGKLDAAGLADVLWCIVMLPEFQLVR
jgi:hypothetical protein